MSNLPEKFTIPEDRIPKPFAQGAIGACVACSITKVLEVINYIKTGEYTEFSKGYVYGRHNRPDKKQSGMGYTYALNSLLERGSVPAEMYTDYDEMPEIRDRLFASDKFDELEKTAEKTKIKAWEHIKGNIYMLENIKKCLYEHQMPLVGNRTGNTQHCVVIVGYDGNKLVYQDHDKAGRLRSIKGGFNAAYYLDGGIEEKEVDTPLQSHEGDSSPSRGSLAEKETQNEVQEESNMYKLMDVSEFKGYLGGLKITRKITLVQLHHTYSPAYAQFTGDNHLTLQNNMRDYHVKTRGFADIAQQFTIFPDGKICTGRDINTAPAGIYGANSTGICIECIGNFDKGGDTMTQTQKNAIVAVTKILLDKFGLNAKTGVTYHCWWTDSGVSLGTYNASSSCKTCPGTGFFGGNTREAYEKNLLPLIEKWGKESTQMLKKVESINDIIWELSNAGIITESALWIKKCQEDKNVYWLCYKMANKLRGTL